MAGIVLTIEVDDKGSVKVKQFSDETKKAFDEMKQGPEAAKPQVDALGESFVGLTAKLAIVMGVVYGVAKAIGSFVDEAAQAETIEKRLQFVTEGLGYTWRDLKGEVDRFANSTQEMTRFSDEEARQALIDMMLYTNEYAKAEEGARLAMDMSIRTGMNLQTSARYIGMAMSGNVEMLGRYIPELKNLDAVLGADATMAEKAAYALKIFQEKFGGAAAMDLETYAGKLQQFKNYWGKLAEEMGNHFLPIATAVLEKLTAIMKATREYKGESEVANLFGDEVMRSLYAYDKEYVRGEFGGSPMKAITGRKDVFPDAGGARKKEVDIVKEIEAAMRGVIAAEEQRGTLALARHELMEEGWGREKDIVEEVKDELSKLERETNAWGEVTVARQELVEEGWKKIDKEAEAAIKAMEGAVPRRQDALKQIEEMTKDQEIVASFASSLSSAWDFNLKEMIKGAESFEDAVKNVFTGIGDAFLATVSKMATNWLIFGSLTGEKGGSSFFGTTGGYGGLIGGIGSLFSLFQEGGIVTRPTPAIIGESGPEAVIPLRDGKIPVEGGGGTVQIINYVTIPDPGQYVRIYGPIIKKLSAQSAAEAKRYRGR